MIKTVFTALGLMLATVAKAETIVLTEKNSVTFRGVVTEETVSKAQLELMSKCKNGNRLYLVLDTPGGSVPDGNQLVDTIKGLDCNVQTVTIFAASMGFHFVQSLEKRLITPNGTLMSHRASLGMKGEIPGEFLTRLNYFYKMLTRMDRSAGQRMGLSLREYQHKIRDEYWVSGPDAVADNAADEVVNVRCGDDLQGTVDVVMLTFFGPITVRFSKCPMITAPLAVEMGAITKENKANVSEYVNTLFNNRIDFVEKYIKTSAWQKFQ